MIRPPPGSTRTDTLFPYTTLFRSPPGAPPRLAATMSARADLVASTKNAAAPIRDNITIATGADAAPYSMYGLRQMLHRHRSEEHTSELQSLMRISYAVFCLKKKKKTLHTPKTHHHTIKQNNN